MLFTDLGSYIPALASLATCAIAFISYRYFRARDNLNKQKAQSDVPPGAVPLREFLDSLHNTLQTHPEISKTHAVNPEFSSSPNAQLLIAQSTSYLKTHGVESEEIAEEMERESARKHAKQPNRRRWSTGHFTELNI